MHRSEWLLIVLVALAAVLALIAWLALGPKDSRLPVERLAATWTLEPRWEKPLPAAAPAASGAGDLAIYLDSSLPLGGFLAPQGHSPASALEALVQLAPQHLVGADQGPTSGIRWHRIADQPARLAKKPFLERRFFSGSESRLDLAVDEIERDLSAGRLEAAILITDLVATGEVVGAQGTARALRSWIESDSVLAGTLDLGLLAIQGRYWGIRSPTCKAPAGDVACWFSEQRQEWLPLPAEGRLPLYVLLFARGREAASRILASLAAELKQRDFVVESELLTAGTAAPEPWQAECEVRSKEDPEHPQFALFGGKGQTFQCARDEVLHLRCRLPDAVATVNAGDPQEAALPLFRMEDGQIGMELDCRRYRDREFSLELRLRGEAAAPAESRWAAWSSITDDRREDLGRTLRLQEFVERIRVRPAAYEISLRLAPLGVVR